MLLMLLEMVDLATVVRGTYFELPVSKVGNKASKAQEETLYLGFEKANPNYID